MQGGSIKRAIPSRGILALSLVAASVVGWALPGKAGAATQLGQVSPNGSIPVDVTVGANTSLVQLDSTTAPYGVPPPGGVITTWSHRGRSPDAGSGRLQAWRLVQPPSAPNQPADFTLVGRSALRAFTAGMVSSFSTRIPVSTGDRLGLRAVEGATGGFYPGVNGDLLYRESGSDPVPGETRETLFRSTGELVNVSARLEPDADRDGFGDETQDGCPTDASTRGPCPPGGGSAPPAGDLISNEFSFGKAKKNKQKGTAKLTVKNLSGPGELELAKNKKVKGKEKTADAGKEKLPIKPKGKAKKKLNRSGKAKAKAKVTFTPDGGEPNTKTKRVKLVKR